MYTINIIDKEYNNDMFNRLAIDLKFPSITFGKVTKDRLCEIPYQTYSLDLDTCINLYKDSNILVFRFNILGFGFAINRQYKY